MLVPLIVTVLGIVLSIIIRPIFISRYIVCSLGCLWLAVSIIVGNYLIKNNIIFYLITILLLTCSMFNINNIISVENNYRNELNRLNTYFNNEKIDENTFMLMGNMNIYDVEQLLGIEIEEFLRLGMNPKEELEPGFNMGILALKIAGKKNGVSKLHGEVSRELF